ncbi:hypothetical protein GN244_ATG14379 [Phytophthora infestans]|uniref:M96 mating-specific protein family n=1 Tax=Phytophthora infestans TaxID=4787 RepID=A0A833T4G8_PHYIN|nr:hypothetical protein GN244_ATG14379 [Phytophthora infestans]KAI9998470.1 hypothetical protein PInf_002858 [Phytophthora infestans]
MAEQYDREGRPFPYTRSKTRWRKRPSDELKYLKAQVVDLEKLLAALSHSDSSRPRLLNDGETTSDNQVEMLQKLYRESEVDKLKDAMKQNQYLRAMLVRKVHLARSLQSAISEQMRLGVRKISWPTREGAADEVIFALLDEEKERQYAVLDEMLEQSGMARVYHHSFSRLLLHQSGKTVSFQHNEVRLLPFAVSDVARALRHSLSFGARVGPTKHCRDIRMYDSYFHAVTADSVQLPDAQSAEVKSRVLQLCVTQPERTVVTWSGYVEYKSHKFIRLLEKTWVVLESIPMPATGGRTHGTLMRVVVRLTPVEAELDPQKPEDIVEMANVVVSTYQRHGQRMLQSMLEQLSDCMRTGTRI